eukprot:NODE_6446_length_505_cov_376.688889.p3 GENE.NODE_6446_length_505_cov_376.688889~~NODE_6446_length_505_cov_376.688889.p3  ORF type:complete len:68 (+),score=27.80 NODE_6446_length_505_cov_376.688889:177-380(+)
MAAVKDPSAELLDLCGTALHAQLATTSWRLKRVLSALRYFEHWYDAPETHQRVTAALKGELAAAPAT